MFEPQQLFIVIASTYDDAIRSGWFPWHGKWDKNANHNRHFKKINSRRFTILRRKKSWCIDHNFDNWKSLIWIPLLCGVTLDDSFNIFWLAITLVRVFHVKCPFRFCVFQYFKRYWKNFQMQSKLNNVSQIKTNEAISNVLKSLNNFSIASPDVYLNRDTFYN